MITFESCLLVDKPAEDLFAFVSDGQNMSKWNVAVREVKQTSPGDVKVGTKYRMVRRLGRRRAVNTFQVTEYDPNKKFCMKTISGPQSCVYCFNFKSFGIRTRLCVAAVVETRGLANVFAPVRLQRIQEEVARVEESLKTLKRLLEDKA